MEVGGIDGTSPGAGYLSWSVLSDEELASMRFEMGADAADPIDGAIYALRCRKVAALKSVIEAFGIEHDRAQRLIEKYLAGHHEHGEGPGELDIDGEIEGELMDIIGYQALRLLLGEPHPAAQKIDAAIVAKALGLWDLVDERRAYGRE